MRRWVLPQILLFGVAVGANAAGLTPADRASHFGVVELVTAGAFIHGSLRLTYIGGFIKKGFRCGGNYFGVHRCRCVGNPGSRCVGNPGIGLIYNSYKKGKNWKKFL